MTQPMSTKGESARCGQDCANSGGFHVGGVAQLNPRARRLKTYTCLTDLVTGQFTVERLIANTLLNRPENPMLFHAGDQRSAFHTQFCGRAIWSSDHPSRCL